MIFIITKNSGIITTIESYKREMLNMGDKSPKNKEKKKKKADKKNKPTEIPSPLSPKTN
jgi:hypothetical protein